MGIKRAGAVRPWPFASGQTKRICSVATAPAVSSLLYLSSLLPLLPVPPLAAVADLFAPFALLLCASRSGPLSRSPRGGHPPRQPPLPLRRPCGPLSPL